MQFARTICPVWPCRAPQSTPQQAPLCTHRRHKAWGEITCSAATQFGSARPDLAVRSSGSPSPACRLTIPPRSAGPPSRPGPPAHRPTGPPTYGPAVPLGRRPVPARPGPAGREDSKPGGGSRTSGTSAQPASPACNARNSGPNQGAGVRGGWGAC